MIMKTTYTYLKNSNTGDLITKQEFSETTIKGIPIYYYRDNKSQIDSLSTAPLYKESIEELDKNLKSIAKKIAKKAPCSLLLFIGFLW